MRDQGKTKKAEQAWFDKLEDELERMEMDELLLAYKLENSKKQINKELVKTASEEDANRPALSDLLKEDESPIAIVKENQQVQEE